MKTRFVSCAFIVCVVCDLLLLGCQRYTSIPVPTTLDTAAHADVFMSVPYPDKRGYTLKQIKNELMHRNLLVKLPFCNKSIEYSTDHLPDIKDCRCWMLKFLLEPPDELVSLSSDTPYCNELEGCRMYYLPDFVYCRCGIGRALLDFELNPLNFGTSYLLVEQEKIDMKNLTFQRLEQPDFADLMEASLYKLHCENNEKFVLGKDTFLSFSAKFLICESFDCGQDLYFLFHYNDKRLYAFNPPQGGVGIFGDANSDNILDYMEILPKGRSIVADILSMNFYTLSTTKKRFVPLKNDQNEPAKMWLQTLDLDFRESEIFILGTNK